tara:strand:+ start:91 stop:375 length:285 start_codon:yes stop_codon:yes gene_type:complete
VPKNNFNKNDFAQSLKDKIGLSSNLSKKIINNFIQVLVENIASGHLSLKNIGSFKIKKKNQRLGRNPKTKKEYIICSRFSVIFTPSKRLTKSLN